MERQDVKKSQLSTSHRKKRDVEVISTVQLDG